jgi:protein phosphatase
MAVAFDALDFAGDSILGDRKTQDDAFAFATAVDEDGGHVLLMSLADGMGGYAGGAQASRIAVTNSIDAYLAASGPTPERLEVGVRAANEGIASAKKERAEKHTEMGCTLVFAAIQDGHLYWASVGDSLLLRCREGQLERLNRDHSMKQVINQLVETGELTAKEAAADPRRNMLRSALHGETIELIDLPEDGTEMSACDTLCIASDGIEALSAPALESLLAGPGAAEARTQRLLSSVENEGRRPLDNTTVILCCARQSWLSRLTRRFGRDV